MQFRDYYATLGVSKSASDAEIKKAFRKLAREHHPDLNPGNAASEARFKEINEAYEVLGDPATRKKYDELGANWKQYEQQAAAGGPGGPGARAGGWSPFGGGGQASYRTMTPDEMDELFGGQDPFSDFFHTFFSGGAPGAGAGASRRSAGAGRRARRAEPPPDQDHPIDLTLEEVLQGAHRRLMVDTPQGAETVDVRIPAGVKEGARIRVAGTDGARGRGDIYLRVRVQPHASFERRGDDLHTRFTVPVTTAVLGGEASVTTMGGQPVRLRVPEGTRSGRVFRVKGHGLPAVGREGRGDLYATADVQIPDRLSPEAREHYEALRALEEKEGTRTS
jgi:DnaJ-class molecular chaperone